jgi:hypothetical protein
VLGVVRKEIQEADSSTDDETWLTLQNRGNKPIIKELLICGYKYEVNAQFILYDKLPKAQLISFDVIQFLCFDLQAL